jgi:hypothetical protein
MCTRVTVAHQVACIVLVLIMEYYVDRCSLPIICNCIIYVLHGRRLHRPNDHYPSMCIVYCCRFDAAH